MGYFKHQAFFVIRFRLFARTIKRIRTLWFSFLGMEIGKRTLLPKISVTWPHQVSIGKRCRLEDDIHFKFDGIYKPGPSIIISDDVFIGYSCEFNIRKRITIGSDSLIASGCRFIDHDHGMKPGELIRKQEGTEKEIVIGNNVWLGCNVVVLKGVQIGDGAVVAAGSVVTKSILPYEIWGGVPAKKISDRSLKIIPKIIQ